MANSSSSSSSGSKQPTRSASAIVARASPDSGSHDLKIDGYSRTKGLGNGLCITSEFFSIGGRLWRLKYYPDGYSGYPDSIAIYLCLDPADVNTTTVQFVISLLDQDGNPVSAYSKTSNTHTFSKQSGGSYGFSQFIKTKELEESADCLKDDVFTLRCVITMAKDIFTETMPASVVVPPPDVLQHLSQLLATGEGADVTFEVGDDKFPAHRCMLAARSSVFKAELLGPMKEKADASVRLNGIKAKVFKAMLHFVYTDSLPHIDAGDAAVMAQHLLVVADRFNLGRLKLMCEDTLRSYIDTSTATTILTLAEQHGCGELKDACFKFLASLGNFKALTASHGFEYLMRTCPSLLKDLAANLAT